MLIKAFEKSEVRFVPHPEGKYAFGILAIDLALQLGSTANGSRFSRSVDEEYKGLIPVKTNGGTQQMVVIWEPGVRQVLVKSRQPNAQKLANNLGLKEILIPSKEAKSISVIKNAFIHLSPVSQFFVAGFRIDLYFPSDRLAVECDELHHSTFKQKEQDTARQDIITKTLGCKWIRYNPDTDDFCIGSVINKIIKSIS
jgi:very-short-patch-repair endonuclease